MNILRELLKPPCIILFGSRIKGDNSEHSDFDFALDCPKPSLEMERKVNEAIEKISGLYKVDIVYLSSVDREFKGIILKTGKVIYGKRRA
ncbi:MAG: nucleotidyltransferase domain-containing protein [Candidatus Omnitrophota bacterium]|nr:nucleotidyltransferase domain-containing protein [Candidatus Omnitrophota bacterium]